VAPQLDRERTVKIWVPSQLFNGRHFKQLTGDRIENSTTRRHHYRDRGVFSVDQGRSYQSEISLRCSPRSSDSRGLLLYVGRCTSSQPRPMQRLNLAQAWWRAACLPGSGLVERFRSLHRVTSSLLTAAIKFVLWDGQMTVERRRHRSDHLIPLFSVLLHWLTGPPVIGGLFLRGLRPDLSRDGASAHVTLQRSHARRSVSHLGEILCRATTYCGAYRDAAPPRGSPQTQKGFTLCLRCKRQKLAGAANGTR
jgi:hypothetical protein